MCGPPHCGPNRNRQQYYNEEDNEDEEYAETVLRNHRDPARDNGRDYQEQRDYQIKVKLPSFNGNVSIEEYLDWVSEMEKFFDYMSIADDKQLCLVAYKLKRGASAWWDRVQLNRTHEQKLPIRSWRRMKRLMADRFLPPDYQQELFRQYQDCRQDTRTANEYMEEFDRLANCNDLEETEDQQISRFVHGL